MNYRKAKAHKSKQIGEAIQQQNNEYIEIHVLDDLTMRPIIVRPNFPTRPLSQPTFVVLKPFLTHIESYVNDNLGFLRKMLSKNQWLNSK